MSSINVDNSNSILGTSKSVSISSSIGQRYLDRSSTDADITDAVLFIVSGNVRVVDASNVIMDIRALLQGEDRDLYRVQRILNAHEFERSGIVASVEFAPRFASSWQGVLVVKTTWQDEN